MRVLGVCVNSNRGSSNSSNRFERSAFVQKNGNKNHKVDIFFTSAPRMIPNKFKDFGVFPCHPLWEMLIERVEPLYVKSQDNRSEFTRDYHRILHSNAYNKLAGKTQVFMAPKSAITSTRMFHVNQVSSIATELANFFGLNVQLAHAAAIGHDLGHTPFGHKGEVIIKDIVKRYGIQSKFWNGEFWHEKNSLRFVDSIETKLDPLGREQNLNLTYATRSAIIGHCGEIDERGLHLSSDLPKLESISKSNRPGPQTWEGATVRVSDKIAYLGKDIEDAMSNMFWIKKDKKELIAKVKSETGTILPEINNTILINKFTADVMLNSSPESGLGFSEEGYQVYKTIKKFNYDRLYIPADEMQADYMSLVLNKLFEKMDSMYNPSGSLSGIDKARQKLPQLSNEFKKWMVKYSDALPDARAKLKYDNKVIYNLKDQNDYRLGIIDFISSLNDKEAINYFNEVTFIG